MASEVRLFTIHCKFIILKFILLKWRNNSASYIFIKLVFPSVLHCHLPLDVCCVLGASCSVTLCRIWLTDIDAQSLCLPSCLLQLSEFYFMSTLSIYLPVYLMLQEQPDINIHRKTFWQLAGKRASSLLTWHYWHYWLKVFKKIILKSKNK